MLLLTVLILAAQTSEPELAPLSEEQPAEAPAATATAVAAQPDPAPADLRPAPFHVGLDVGLDVPTGGALPMASARADFGYRLGLGDSLFAGVGLRSGYSYVAEQGPVVDDARGEDPAAFSMVHRIPLRIAGRLGVFGKRLAVLDGPGEAGLIGSVGGDVAVVRAHSFGRTVDVVGVVPGFSVGGYALLHFGALSAGLLGELDQARLAAPPTPGVDGDLSAVRVSLILSTSFGG